jgi:[ribosomal protein S18]-alanine N-acetyltransferase
MPTHPTGDERPNHQPAPTEIRPAALDDLVTVAAWVRDQDELTRWTGPRYQFPLDPTRLPEQFDWASSDTWVVTDGGDVVAFGQLLRRGPDRQHLARIITAPHRRGEGLGARIVLHLLGRARELGATVATLNVRPDNDAALRLYLRLGFAPAERPPEDPPLVSTFLAIRW